MKNVSELFGPLKKYHADSDVFEFCVDAFDDVYVEKNGKIINDDKAFKNEKELFKTIEALVESVERKISAKNPYADIRLADGTRVTAIIPPMSTTGPSLLVRKPVKQDVDLQQIVEWKGVDEKGAQIIREGLLAGKNIVLAGMAGTGKMTMMNAFIKEMNPEWRVICAEKNREVEVERKRYVALETLKGTQEEFLELVKKAQGFRGDYLVATRADGDVAIKLLEYMRGETSVLMEMTANGASDLLKRLEVFGLTSLNGAHREDVQFFITDAIDMVVTMGRDSKTGRRFIEHIAEVKGLTDEGKYDLESLYVDSETQE